MRHRHDELATKESRTLETLAQAYATEPSKNHTIRHLFLVCRAHDTTRDVSPEARVIHVFFLCLYLAHIYQVYQNRLILKEKSVIEFQTY